MQHKKTFFILLIAVLLFTTSGSAFAQGTTPPSDLSAPKSAFVSPEAIPSGHEAGPALVPPPLVNGTFEQGPNVGWTENSVQGWDVVVALPSGFLPAHSGAWVAWLGGDDNEVSTITQTVTLPGASFLRLYYWVASAENTCGPSERAYVHIFDIDANVGKDVSTWQLCKPNNTSGWVARDIDLTEFGAKTVRITIEATTNALADSNSNFFVDDVSLYESFADVSYDHWAESYIQRLYNAGITGGCGGTPQHYCPDTAVTRDQMAVFLLKGMNGSSYTPPAVGAATGFSDVPTTYWAAAWIKQLAAEKITGGCGAGVYCPTSPVTRDQMAVFLLKAKYGFNYTPPAVGGSTGFTDVPPDHWAAAWIKQLATEGITGGCGTGLYCPGNPVNRAEMAVFLVRTFGLP